MCHEEGLVCGGEKKTFDQMDFGFLLIFLDQFEISICFCTCMSSSTTGNFILNEKTISSIHSIIIPCISLDLHKEVVFLRTEKERESCVTHTHRVREGDREKKKSAYVKHIRKHVDCQLFSVHNYDICTKFSAVINLLR